MSNKDVRSKYEQITSELFGNKHKLAEFLAFSGRFYKLPSAQAMAVFMESLDAKMVADYDTWQKFGRQVNEGMEKWLKHIEGELDYAKENLDAARKNLATPFEHAAELAEKSARLEKLDRELNLDKADEVIIDNEEEDHNDDLERGEDFTPKKPKSPKR